MDWEKCLADAGVFWQYPGHGPHAQHLLTKKHSDFYWNSDYLSQNTVLLRNACEALATTAKKNQDLKMDWVLTYPPFGSTMAFCLAEFFHAKFGYIFSLEQPQLYFDIEDGQSALVCADDLLTGTSLKKVLDAAHAKGCKVLEPILVAANLSGMSMFEGRSVKSLLTREINVWNAEDCPLCQKGSKPLLARANWQKLLHFSED